MGRTILTIAGVILAIWLAFTVLGFIMSMLKFFFIVGFFAVVIVLVVTLVSKSSRRG
ncbi:hypothetical protein [Actinomadura logoneensis]|uniref:hypothetical protein n=1 Tax=Actinomadura logoneensis TaxID=2293572 RepID=UPI0018F211B8|nr:hypothetical protein [Actinomadura logoneensis]